MTGDAAANQLQLEYKTARTRSPRVGWPTLEQPRDNPTQPDPYTRTGFAPLRAEYDVERLAVTGRWPAGLHGTLYRIGPNPQFDPIEPYNPLQGDGMVHAFFVDADRVAYRNRWVRTQRWQLENAAGRALFATSGDPRQHDPEVASLATTDGAANTNLVWHARLLLALEEGHAPIELDPVTLDTRGVHTFDGALPGNLTAHPRIDPDTGELIGFANFPNRRFDGRIEWYAADADGAVIRRGDIQAPFPGLVHDFAITRDFMVFPVCPVTVSVARARAGGPPLAWEPDKLSRVAVVRRTPPFEARWFTAPPRFAWHVLNAWSSGDEISMNVCEQAAPALPRPDGTIPEPDSWRQHLARWTLRWSAPGRFACQTLCDEVCEYPRFDERFATRPVRCAFVACHGGPGTGDLFHRGIGRYDTTTGSMTTYRFGDTQAVSEPVFVPRSSDAKEGDGYLLCVVYDEAADRSRLVLLDTDAVDAGPRAEALLDHRVPMGFHGCWVNAAPAP